MNRRRRRHTSVPDLRLERLAVYVDRTSGEFDANGRLRVEVELVACESRKNCGL
jgi:hypothetical protein